MLTTLPADPETERLAKEVARITGKPLPTVIREAIAATAAAEGVVPPRLPADMERVRAILARMDSLPIRDPRSADEIVGFDELGLPR